MPLQLPNGVLFSDIPAPLLKKGENEIIVFETEGKICETIVLKNEPDIG